jgi:pyridoxamine 5'-phosphate oxidase
VLCRSIGPKGFGFFTNVESAKGRALTARPKAAGLFHWKSLRRQVRLRGPVEPIGEAETLDYFQTRARQSRIGAWASAQSRPLDARATLEAKVAEVAARFENREIDLPPFWRGFRVIPIAMEFWSDGAHRLHDRVQFSRGELGAPWSRQRLYP